MDVNKDSIRVGGYILTPDPHASDRGAAARFAQSELRRFADANARRAITALHDDAQRLVPRHLAGTATNPGMAVSTRTGTLVTRLGFEAAAEEIALVRSVSSPTAERDLNRAETLATDLPEVLAALPRGTLGPTHADTVAGQALRIVPAASRTPPPTRAPPRPRPGRAPSRPRNTP